MNICRIRIQIFDLNHLQRMSIKYLYTFEDFFGLDNFLNFQIFRIERNEWNTREVVFNIQWLTCTTICIRIFKHISIRCYLYVFTSRVLYFINPTTILVVLPNPRTIYTFYLYILTQFASISKTYLFVNKQLNFFPQHFLVSKYISFANYFNNNNI